MDAHEPQTPDDEPAAGWSKGWTVRLGADGAPRQPELDPEVVAAGRAALQAMSASLGEAHRQSVLLDASIATLAAQGASSGHIAGLGLSVPVAERLLDGMSAMEWTCRDGVAHFDRAAGSGPDPAD